MTDIIDYLAWVMRIVSHIIDSWWPAPQLILWFYLSSIALAWLYRWFSRDSIRGG